MKRKILDKLIEWKNSANRMPLVLQGARQTGKTYIVNYFGGKEYQETVYCNFEKDKNLASIFSNLSPQEIVPKIETLKRQRIFPEKTLLVFDEIQACPEALTSLKYFYEDAPEYHVIAMGSLLGVSVNRGVSSFPVGKVQFLDMYPMDFEEYLWARGEDVLVAKIKDCFSQNAPMDEALHEYALRVYREYLFVGGMPAVVSEFMKTQSPNIAAIIGGDILASYQNDMGKYNKQSEIPKTKLVYANISTQLAKENKKFQYKYIKSGSRASEFENAIEWVCLAGIASRVFRLQQIMLPLRAYRDVSDFKFYMNDTGLCCRAQDILYNDVVFANPLLTNFLGGLTENYVYTQLRSNGYEPYYWTIGSQAEVDFIIRRGDCIVPIEVKASTNVTSKSLNVYMSKFSPEYAIRISAKNFGFDHNIKSVPLYAVWCL